MEVVQTLLSLGASLLSFVFAAAVFRRYAARPTRKHLLVWGIGLVFYGIGTACEVVTSVWGFHPLVLKVWYLFGAILVAAWLGQGTIFLLAPDRWVRLTTVLLVAASLFAAWAVAVAEVDLYYYTMSMELSGRAFTTTWVRMITPFFNIYGTVALVGGALYSAWLFWRKRVWPYRMLGNLLIATGALAPAIGGTLSRLGLPGLYVGEFIGVCLMYLGFVLATASTTGSLVHAVAES